MTPACSYYCPSRDEAQGSALQLPACDAAVSREPGNTITLPGVEKRMAVLLKEKGKTLSLL